jgi:hypothetical protein
LSLFFDETRGAEAPIGILLNKITKGYKLYRRELGNMKKFRKQKREKED